MSTIWLTFPLPNMLLGVPCPTLLPQRLNSTVSYLSQRNPTTAVPLTCLPGNVFSFPFPHLSVYYNYKPINKLFPAAIALKALYGFLCNMQVPILATLSQVQHAWLLVSEHLSL